MSYPISPGVYQREIDLSLAAQNAIATSAGIVGKFQWGPIGEIVRVANELDLVARFGEPVDDNAIDFFLASSYLAFSNALDVVRAGDSGVTKPLNAVSVGLTGVYIPNDDAYDPEALSIAAENFVAKFPGELANGLKVHVCSSASQYETTLPGTFTFTRTNTVAYTPLALETLSDYFTAGDFIVVDGARYLVTAITGSPEALKLSKIYSGSLTPTTKTRRWAYANRFGGAPTTGRHHIVVVDAAGKFSEEAGTVLRAYENVSLVAGTKYADGTSAYIVDVLAGSNYVRAGGADLSTNVTELKALVSTLNFGTNAWADIGTDDYLNGWSLFIPTETIELPLAIGGAIDSTISNFIVQNVAEVRKDTVAFFSPALASVVNNKGNEAADCVTDRQILPSTSYATMDCNWKYMYDKYNDKYRWIPCAGDHAGIYARVDREGDPWQSAAGTSRGIIKGVVKLAWNPDETARDTLYQNEINPIVDFPSSGPTVYGDKTLLHANTALSRINVRRLMLVVEQIVVEASRGLLFEFNDEFTQARFVAIVDPFLRGVQGRRGITAYKVVADSSVNTPDVVQNNQFVAQVFVKPNYSINFIRIDFVVVGASVDIEEAVVGA